jgi:hypothetical protein
MRIFSTVLLVGLTMFPVLAADGIDLTIIYGPNPADVTLQWTGNQPIFQAYRSSKAASFTNPANPRAETGRPRFSPIAPLARCE